MDNRKQYFKRESLYYETPTPSRNSQAIDVAFQESGRFFNENAVIIQKKLCL